MIKTRKKELIDQMFTHPETEERIYAEVITLQNILRELDQKDYQGAIIFLYARKNSLVS